MRVDAVHHIPVRDGVVQSASGVVVCCEVRIAEGDPVRGCDVVGEDVELTVRVEEVTLRCAKDYLGFAEQKDKLFAFEKIISSR